MSTRTADGGFTIIEILIAVVVSAIGFAAIFSMQISTMQGHIAARENAAALNLAERFAEDLRAEAYTWTGNTLPGPRLSAGAGAWRTLTDVPGGLGRDPRDGLPVDQNAMPFQGDDATGSGLVRQRFCVHYWINPLTAAYNGILNGRVRVVWPRDPLNPLAVTAACTRAGATAFVDDVSRFVSLSIPVTIRRHPR